MPSKIFLIRHGATDWNAEHRYCGFVDVPLNSKGKSQARRLGKRMEKETINHVYSSDRKRALQTAGIAFKGRDINVVEHLREMNFGIFEGLTYKQILKKHPEVYNKWIKEPFEIIIPAGESLKAFRRRVVCAFKEITQKHRRQNVAIVCHGGAISVFLGSILKSRDFWRYIPDSASLCILAPKRQGLAIEVFNDTKHLAGIKIDAVKFKKG